VRPRAGHPRLLEELATAGAATATTLAARVPVSRQAVVKHLAVLNRADLVTGRRQPQRVAGRYTQAPSAA
jgi:predicted ArsR family transcriptional regulator